MLTPDDISRLEDLPEPNQAWTTATTFCCPTGSHTVCQVTYIC